MVAGLKFLSKKSFNPQNLSNQKRVWEREQEKKSETRRAQERAAQLQRERDDEELAKARGETPRLGFLYDAPPGVDDKKIDDDKKPSAKPPSSLTERQPGDDDAAAAFRHMLAAATAGTASDNEGNDDVERKKGPASSFSTILHGTADEVDEEEDKARYLARKAQLTELEKAVGRKKNGGQALTLDEQIERFPALANAPRAKGIGSSDVGVNFKPLGSQIRNVKCMACGIWGHNRGDRECKVSGWNPFEAVQQRPSTEEEADAARASKSGPTRERSSSTSTRSDDSSEYRRRERRRKRKHKKERRRHREDSDNDNRRSRKHHKKSHKRHKKDA